MKTLSSIHKNLKSCRACPEMCGVPVHGSANLTKVMLIGQAPGPHEADLGKPFAYTAGKTLFKWLYETTGLAEEELREKIYFAAVARCFPGKKTSGSGDRVPTGKEILNCRKFLEAEVNVLKPTCIIAVGKLAISEVLGPKIFPKNAPLDLVVGKKFFIHYHGIPVEVIPLPHPSGISMWYKKEPGKTLLTEGLKALGKVISENSLF